jgi:transcriptional regulator with XRE-family HTH domain
VPSTDAPEAVYKLIGERLAKLREERATTQEDLGMFAGLTRASIANIEKGRQRVFLHQLYRFADYLGVKLTDLLPDPEKVRFARVVPEAEAAYLDKLRKHVFISTGGRHRQNRRRV